MPASSWVPISSARKPDAAIARPRPNAWRKSPNGRAPALHRPWRPARTHRRRNGRGDPARRQPWRLHPRAGGRGARNGACGLLRRESRHLVRERHRSARHGADGERHPPRRRGGLPELHLRGDGRGGGVVRRDAGFRRRRRGQLQPRPGEPRACGRDRAADEPPAGGRHHRRSFRPAGGLRRNRADLRPRGLVDAVRRGSELRRRVSRPQCRRNRRDYDDELFSGKAARLLRRRRRDLLPKCRARLGAALDPRARSGRRQIRERAHRPQRPARHHSGGGPDREAQDLPRRDRHARAHRPALQRSFARGGHRARGGRGLDLCVGPVHDPHPGSRPGRVPGRPQARRHPDRDLLPEAAPPPDRLQALSERRQRAARLRASRRRGDQPADASLPHRGGPGSHRRCGQGRVARRRARPPRVVAATAMNDAARASESVEELSAQDRLLRQIASRRAKVGVIGLGYVGIPLALIAARAGFPVLGFDVNEARVQQINRGESFIRHIAADAIRSAIKDKRFEATADFRRLEEVDAILICVPTPLTPHREPDLSFVIGTARAIAERLRPAQLVVLESTTYPGTTNEVLKPILEATGLKSGTDFFLAFSPEREDPGNEHFGTGTIPKVVGGDGPEALAAAKALYDVLVVETVPVSSTATAEAVKLTENVFRAVNIALVNELKVVYDAMGIDVWEVIEAAKTKPFGFMPFYPGPGLGGHCIPIDPFYLTWKAREYEIATRFIELAGEINTRMPNYVVERLIEAIDRRLGKGLSGSAILLIGIAFKKNVDDMRESPSLKLIALIEARGGSVDYHDPFIEVMPPTREYPHFAGRRSVALSPRTIASYDAVLIATDHDGIDYAAIIDHAQIVIDTRNACARAGLASPKIVKA